MAKTFTPADPGLLSMRMVDWIAPTRKEQFHEHKKHHEKRAEPDCHGPVFPGHDRLLERPGSPPSDPQGARLSAGPMKLQKCFEFPDRNTFYVTLSRAERQPAHE